MGKRTNRDADTVIFKDMRRAGEEGFRGIANFISDLNEAGFSLADDDTYYRAGLKGRADLARRAARHAMGAAAEWFAQGRAVEDAGFVLTQENAGGHPSVLYEFAYGWLLKADRPLFADKTYAPLGVTRDEFFVTVQQSQIDAVRQKTRLAQALLASDPESPASWKLMHDVYQVHLKRLGIDGIDARAEKTLDLTAGELDTAHYAALQGHLRRHLKIASEFRFRGGLSYYDAVIDAFRILLENEALDTDPATFAGTNFTRESFEREADRSLEGLIRNELGPFTAGNMDAEDIYRMLENMDSWRKMFSAVEPPEHASTFHAHEDFWFHGVLADYDFRSFSHFMDSAKKSYAARRAQSVVCDPGAAVSIYDTLHEIENILKDARVPPDREDAYAAIGIDHAQFHAMLDETAAHAARRDWSYAFDPGLTTPLRLELVTFASDAAMRIANKPQRDKLPAGMTDASQYADALRLRRAEELLAQAYMCINGQGAYPALHDALEMLDLVEADILAPATRRRMGMSFDMARHFESWHDRLDMADLWKAALDDDDDVVQRHLWLSELDTRLAALDAPEQAEFMAEIGITGEEYAAQRVSVAEAALSECAERIQANPNDSLANAELYRRIHDCLVTIDPTALENDIAFKHIMGVERESFLKLSAETMARADVLTASAAPAGHGAVAGIAAMLIDARDGGYDGAAAYRRVRAAARHAEAAGYCVTDAPILAEAGFTMRGFHRFVQQQAYRAARDSLDVAMAKGLGPVTQAAAHAHAYNDYAECLRWLVRAEKPILQDAPYRALGLVGRHDFLDRLREAALDFTVQIEQAILREGISSGPLTYLRLLRELRDGYQLLGLENARDDHASAPDELRMDTVTVRTVRSALRTVGFTACESIIRSDSSNAAKFHQLQEVFTFARRMNADEWPDPVRQARMNMHYSEIVAARIRNALDRFGKKHADNAAHGIRIANAVLGMRDALHLQKTNWFQPLFNDFGFNGFEGFAEQMAIMRIDQLYKRANGRLKSIKDDKMGGEGLNRDILRDLGRIRIILKSDLIDADRIEDVLEYAKVDREWLDVTYRTSACVAMPLLARLATDPTLEVADRIEAINDCRALRDEIGSENPFMQQVDWKAMDALYRQTALRAAAANILPDMVRGVGESMSDSILHAEAALEDAGLSFLRKDAGPRMGLTPDEASRYKALYSLMLPYGMLSQIEQADPGDIQTQYNLVYTLHDYARAQAIDLTEAQTLRRLDLRSLDEFKEIADSTALHVLSGFYAPLDQLPADRKREQIESIIEVMDITGIENRIGPDMLREAGLPPRASLEAMLAQYPLVKKAAPRRSAPRPS